MRRHMGMDIILPYLLWVALLLFLLDALLRFRQKKAGDCTLGINRSEARTDSDFRPERLSHGDHAARRRSGVSSELRKEDDSRGYQS